MMRLGLLGCGSIGSAVAAAIIEGKLPGIELAGVVDIVEKDEGTRLADLAGCPFLKDFPFLLSLRPDLVVEAASQQAVREFAPRVLEAGIDIMLVSVGALADPELLARLTDLATKARRTIYVPSGAIGGLDIIKGAAVAGLEECRLTTTKPPRALAGTAWPADQGIRIEALKERTVVYEGMAAEAVRLFPQNVNVAASISLAGIGFDRTTVRIVADPAADRNVHEVFLKGAFGEATIRLENLPSPANPRSSYLTCLSVIAALRQLSQNLRLGT